ncbi:MAG: YdiU family protein [Zetaproteobacteria bacterium]|nr:YdiU family protein [Zetaproteobacteria bacterium]
MLQKLDFQNPFTTELPADGELENYNRLVEHACYSWVTPSPVAQPQLIAYSTEMAACFQLTEHDCRAESFAQLFAGNQLPPTIKPYATCYGGHQFGSWAGQLGDGRAINLGEIIDRSGTPWTLQLKGAGPTPYSRHADGRAVLRSSIREFLCSEAMAHLGIPTTRALSLIATGDAVARDMLYNGNTQMEPGAIVCRTAPSFTRFGQFQLFSKRNDVELLKTFTDYTINHDFPHLGAPSQAIYLQWFQEVVDTTIDLMVHWARVGFVHGVMNTDNMSILGLTLDYGPYGWLDDFNPDWTPNTTDRQTRRYRFGKQGEVAGWNLARLAESLIPLIGSKEPLQAILNHYRSTYHARWSAMMMQKLGLQNSIEGDQELIESLQSVLCLTEIDMTLFYRALAKIESHIPLEQQTHTMLMQSIHEALYQPEQITTKVETAICAWLTRYIERLKQQPLHDVARKIAMNQINPKFILRNYLTQQAIDAAYQGDYSMIETLLQAMRNPYDEQPQQQSLAQKRPDWAKHRVGCSMLSCSS